MLIDNREYSEPELKSYIKGLLKRIADAENLNSELKKENEELCRKNADHVLWETKLLKALEQVAKDIAAFKTVLVENNCRLPCEKCLLFNDGKDECEYNHMSEIKKLIGGDDNAVTDKS